MHTCVKIHMYVPMCVNVCILYIVGFVLFLFFFSFFSNQHCDHCDHLGHLHTNKDYTGNSLQGQPFWNSSRAEAVAGVRGGA